MRSWMKHFSGYQFIEWNEGNFDIHCNRYVEEAYTAGKWMYVSDYARLLAIYQYGGIYLDTDVLVYKSFDGLLDYEAFTSFGGDNQEIAAHVMACRKGHQLFKAFLDSYKNRVFIQPAATFDTTSINRALTNMLIAKGFRTNGERQRIEGLEIFPMTYFCPVSFVPDLILDCFSKDTYANHLWSAKWLKRARSPLIRLAKKMGLGNLKRYVVSLRKSKETI